MSLLRGRVRPWLVLAVALGPGVIRLMTHLDVDDDGVDLAAKAIAGAP